MADGLNRVQLLGFVGQDPELRYTQSNVAVLTVRMATTESWFDAKTKEKKENTQWHTVIVWDKRGEALNKYIHKGSKIFVEGGIQTRSYDAKDGTKRYITEIKANNIILLDSKGSRQNEADGGSDQPSFDGGGASTDDDIPFFRFDIPA